MSTIQDLCKEYLAYVEDKSPTKETSDKHRYWKYILLDIRHALDDINHPDKDDFSLRTLDLINGLSSTIDELNNKYLEECCHVLQDDPRARLPDPPVIDYSELDE